MFFVVLIITIASFAVSCGHSNANQRTDIELDETGHGDTKEYTSAYICPMHCAGSGNEEAGKCPVCKMKLVTKEKHDSREHKHL